MSDEIGCRKSPKPCRMPIASVRMRPPQTRTTVGVRQSAVRAVMAGFRRCSVQPGCRCGAGCSSSTSASRPMSASSSCVAQLPRDLRLRTPPVRQRAREGRLARARQRNLARPRVAPRRDPHEVPARPADRGCATAPCGRASRPSRGRSCAAARPRERAQQRELRDAQAGRRQRVVVELRQRARGAAQAAADAGGRDGGIGAEASGRRGQIGAYARNCEYMHVLDKRKRSSEFSRSPS